MIIEEVGRNGHARLIEVAIEGAEVVLVWREARDPWRWSERPTRIQRWAAGTMVVVIGRTDTTGTIYATRVELPRIDVR